MSGVAKVEEVAATHPPRSAHPFRLRGPRPPARSPPPPAPPPPPPPPPAPPPPPPSPPAWRGTSTA
eukprot:59316-Prorocentrum_minimum.AAC.1